MMASSTKLSTCRCQMLMILMLLHLAITNPAEATLMSNYAGKPCPGDTVILTCTVTGDLISWESPSLFSETVVFTRDFNPVNDTQLPAVGDNIIITLTDLTPTTMTSTFLVNTNVIGVQSTNSLEVTCVSVGTETIQLAGSPSPPLRVNSSVVSRSVNSSTVSVGWDPPTDNGGREDLSYMVFISPPAQLSAAVVTSTSVTVTDADYNVDYTVSVVATNCAGNSSTVEYNLTVVTCADPIFNTGVTLRSASRSVYTNGDTIMYSCPNTMATLSTCRSDRMWFPDTSVLVCPMIVTCAPPSAPTNGSIVDNVTDPSLEGTVINYTCDANLFPIGNQPSTCVDRMMTGEWNPDPADVVCSTEPFSCTLPDPPTNGLVAQISNTTIVFGCNEGFSPQQNTTANCVAEEQWSREPEEIVCMMVTIPTASAIGPIVGGVVGGLLVVIIVIAIIVVVCVLMAKHKDRYNAVDEGMEMEDQGGLYSQTTHAGPRNDSRQNRASPPEEDGYHRADRPVDPALQAYDDVTLNPEERVNDDGYNVLNGNQGPQRLPGYGQLNNVNPVEPVIYADLGTRGLRPNGNRDQQQVDQHRVDYASVDHIATAHRAATMPASPERPPPPNPTADADKLLNLDQALVQLRPVQPRWQELAAALRVPETYVQQIEDMCRNDHANAMTEVVDYWMRSCSGRPTWRQLADGLKRIREDHLAQQLMSIYDTGRLPVELDMNEVPPEVYKYDHQPPPPVPVRSPTVDSPGLSRTLPTRAPPKFTDSPAPLPPANEASKDAFTLPPRPPKPTPKH